MVHYAGGASVEAKGVTPLEGEASHGAKITSVAFKAGKLVVHADVLGTSRFILRTSDTPQDVQGAKLTRIAEGVYELTVESSFPSYHSSEIVVELSSKAAALTP